MPSPRYSAGTLFKLVLLVTWTCLEDTPFSMKNTLFARFFSSLDVLESTALLASLSFAPGLFSVLQAATPPAIQFFQSLPVGPKNCWGIYALVLEKPGSRPGLYIGSGTSTGTPTAGGVALRFKQYDDGFLIPKWIKVALKDGYTITHKGLLCWIPRPGASDVPVFRLLFIALEATFTYIFWALKARHGGYGDFGYDGLCSHAALNEGVPGQFDLSPEELETLAKEREEKRLILKAQNNSSWHYKQMAENYDEYITAANVRVAKSRANNPGRNKKYQETKIKEALEEQRFHCELCGLFFGTKQRLRNHENTPKHRRKSKQNDSPFVCKPCDLAYHNQSNLTRHEKSARHQQNVLLYKEKH
ncbi:uncharacterized protein ColSpa_02353 [Colletotrichum spaethianum]|uniref:C2H2-type domain-containing protein n=1 Tax=Colletotrichum spaethianum TaxID=700344 RepID=A0AA37NUL2_9PEZI|nr:uncharacterized protein ColSpa_02353 [Colletotrichum spaethianum]GKT42172.1 hypothetical protein ColSpa_02353 [Colletotrichum spaethianum]